MAPPAKSEGAFRTIGELAELIGVPQHILRYWETRFPQLKPLQRAGNRRYYRPADVALAQRIDRLLNQQGYTVRGVQKLLDQAQPEAARERVPELVEVPAPIEASSLSPPPSRASLHEVRDLLVQALEEDKRG